MSPQARGKWPPISMTKFKRANQLQRPHRQLLQLRLQDQGNRVRVVGVPFSAMVAQMGLGSGAAAPAAPAEEALLWTQDAQEKLAKLPSFVQPMVKGSVETYARKNGFKSVTLQIMDDSKNSTTDGIQWTPAAQERLDNIPDFIRPMAKREIERLVKEKGGTEITADMMEEAKEKFMKFM